MKFKVLTYDLATGIREQRTVVAPDFRTARKLAEKPRQTIMSLNPIPGEVQPFEAPPDNASRKRYASAILDALTL